MLLVALLLAAPGRAQGSLDKLVRFKANDQELAKVMAALATFTGVNILVSPTEAKRKVTINLRDVPGRKAIELIAKLNRLQVRDVDGDEKIFVIATQEVFEKEFEQGLTEPVRLKFAAAAKMASILQKALSKAGNVTIEVDERTNTLIVSGTKLLIDRTKELIDKLDKPVPQVLIDSKIVSVATNVLKDIGFQWDWGTGFNQTGDQAVTSNGSGPLLTFVERQRINNNTDFFQGGNADGAEVLRFGDFYRGNLFFDAVFQALETNSIARSLASPRLLAVNGAKAQLRIGDEVVFSGGPSQGPESKETGIILDVEPRINKDGFITMDVSIEQSTATFDRPDFPTISKTNAKTSVQVRDGEEVLIGGLVTESNNHSEERIPFLADIPLIKHFFTRKRDQPRTNELVILMTPRVIKQSVPGIGEATGGGAMATTGGGLGDDSSLGGGLDDDLGGPPAGGPPPAGGGGLDDDFGLGDDDFGDF